MKTALFLISMFALQTHSSIAAPLSLQDLLALAKSGKPPAQAARDAAATGLAFTVSNRDIHALQKAGFSPAEMEVLGDAAPIDDETALSDVGVYSFHRFNIYDTAGETNVEGMPSKSSGPKVAIGSAPAGVEVLSCSLTYTDQVEEALPADEERLGAGAAASTTAAFTSYLTTLAPKAAQDRSAVAVTMSEGEIRYPILDLPIANQRGEELVLRGIELEVIDAVLDAAPILEVTADEKLLRIVNRGWGAARIDGLQLVLGRAVGEPDETSPRLEVVKESSLRKLQVEAAGEVSVPLSQLFPDLKIVGLGQLQDRIPELREPTFAEQKALFVACKADYAGFTGLRRPPYDRIVRGPYCAALQAFLFDGMLALKPIVAEGDLGANLFVAFKLDPEHKGQTHALPMNWKIAVGGQERVLIGLVPRKSGLYKLRLRIRFGTGETLETQPKIVRLVKPSRKGYCDVSN